MPYIKNKLNELIDTYRKETGFTEYDARMIAERLIADYHNHIVEMFSENKQDYKLYDGNIITAITMPKIRELLQDNPASQDKE